eukprot:TRINITY_DN10785_c0_g2_i1.p1 TRINITY_DN10785_c0_g2~~TRINITY_DN10785_c0_g2_i1.p1  ORF type:complete len:506 (+),score=34.67 TRINITY_DN10785_c0_g2_i1:878-2395(+)
MTTVWTGTRTQTLTLTLTFSSIRRRPYLNQRSHIRWKEWVANLQSIAANPMNVVAANSKFELEYIKFHTGLNATYLPSWCGGAQTWPVILGPPSRHEILLGPYRDNLDSPDNLGLAWAHPILQSLDRERADYIVKNVKMVPEFERLGYLYPHYETSDLVNHPCVVLLPYQISVISFFEFYRMNIPLFVPSKKLLISWHMEHNTLWERSYGHPAHLMPAEETAMPDPYSDRLEDLEYWIGLSDWYQYEHVIQFDSWTHMLDLYFSTDLSAIRFKMAEVNRRESDQLVHAWRAVLAKVKRHATPRRLMPKQFSHALSSLYQVPPLGPDPPLTIATKPNMPHDTLKAAEMGQDCPVFRDENLRCMCNEFVDFGSNPACMQERTVAGEHWWTTWCIPNQLWFPPKGKETQHLVKVPSPKPFRRQEQRRSWPLVIWVVLFGLAVVGMRFACVLCHVRRVWWRIRQALGVFGDNKIFGDKTTAEVLTSIEDLRRETREPRQSHVESQRLEC